MKRYTITEQVKLFGSSDYLVITPESKIFICDNAKSAEARRQQLIVHDFLELCTEAVAEVNAKYKYSDSKEALSIKHSRNRLFEFISKMHNMRVLKTSTLVRYIFTLHVIEIFDDFSYSQYDTLRAISAKASTFFDVHLELETSYQKQTKI